MKMKFTNNRRRRTSSFMGNSTQFIYNFIGLVGYATVQTD